MNTMVMYVVAMFFMAGEPRFIRLEVPTVQQCIQDIQTVENILDSLGAQLPTVFCMIGTA